MLWATNKNRFLPCSALAQCVPHCNLLSYTEDTLVCMALSLSYSSGRNALLWEHSPWHITAVPETKILVPKQTKWLHPVSSNWRTREHLEGPLRFEGCAELGRREPKWTQSSGSDSSVMCVQNHNQKTCLGAIKGHAFSHTLSCCPLHIPSLHLSRSFFFHDLSQQDQTKTLCVKQL